jgi:hypothetical protein
MENTKFDISRSGFVRQVPPLQVSWPFTKNQEIRLSRRIFSTPNGLRIIDMMEV